MAALFDQTHRSGVYTYETLASAGLSMDDTYPDENLFGFFSSSLPSHHSSPVFPRSKYGSTDPYSNFSGSSSEATTDVDFDAGAHYGAQEVDTPVSLEMGYYSSPAQMWAPPPSRMQGLSEAWDDVTPVAPVAQVPVAIGSPVSTGALCDASIDGPATPIPSLAAPMNSLPGAAADCIPVRTAQKRRAGDDEDEGRVMKRPRHTADPIPRAPPDPRTGLAPPGETLIHTSIRYKTVVPEETPRERQTLASLPPAETGPSTQQGPNRPTARATEAAPELQPVVPGEDGREGRSERADTLGKKKVTCAWPAPLETGGMCTKGYGRHHDMFRHVQSKHLRIPYECPECGTYILRELKAHQRSDDCGRARRWTELGRTLRGQGALVDKGVTRVLKGERLVDDEVRSILETVRRLIEAGRSHPDDIEDGIDGWMKEHGKVWQKVVDIAHAHAPPS